MRPGVIEIAIVLFLYVAVVLVVGLWAARRSSRSPDEYFLAGRSLGTLVLFMALFGTNCTAFVLVGIPGQAYHDGIGTFSVNAPAIALGVPLTFWAIGAPARRMAARLGALTPAELYARRFGSPALGVVLFVFFTVFTLPYMVTAVKGAAITLAGVTGGAVPQWLGGLGVLAVALLYTSLGGMRATAWTNVVQGLIFLVFVIVALVFISMSLGGPRAAMQAVAERDPGLFEVAGKPLLSPAGFTSWSLAIGLAVIAFPHMLVRLMAGKSDATLKGVCQIYPVALIILWIPVVLIGVWGAAAFPGLEGRASDRIFSLMTSQHMPAILGSFGLLAVLAAVMSTLDAQILTLGSMLTRDVLDRIRPQSERREVTTGRVFGVLIAAAVYAMAQTAGASIFEMARLAFSGYVTLVPALLLGVRWQRFTAPAALLSIAAGNAVLALGELSWMPLLGFLPVFWALIAAALVAVAAAVLTAPPDRELTAHAFAS